MSHCCEHRSSMEIQHDSTKMGSKPDANSERLKNIINEYDLKLQSRNLDNHDYELLPSSKIMLPLTITIYTIEPLIFSLFGYVSLYAMLQLYQLTNICSIPRLGDASTLNTKKVPKVFFLQIFTKIVYLYKCYFYLFQI